MPSADPHLFQLLVHHSRFGQHLQAVGGNRDMAQMSGLNVRRLTVYVWLLAGIALAAAASRDGRGMSMAAGVPTNW